MNEEYLKGFFQSYVLPKKSDATYDDWVSKIKDNVQYKQGMFDAYVKPNKSDATFEDWNTKVFGTTTTEPIKKKETPVSDGSPVQEAQTEPQFQVGVTQDNTTQSPTPQVSYLDAFTDLEKGFGIPLGTVTQGDENQSKKTFDFLGGQSASGRKRADIVQDYISIQLGKPIVHTDENGQKYIVEGDANKVQQEIDTDPELKNWIYSLKTAQEAQKKGQSLLEYNRTYGKNQLSYNLDERGREELGTIDKLNAVDNTLQTINQNIDFLTSNPTIFKSKEEQQAQIDKEKKDYENTMRQKESLTKQVDAYKDEWRSKINSEITSLSTTLKNGVKQVYNQGNYYIERIPDEEKQAIEQKIKDLELQKAGLFGDFKTVYDAEKQNIDSYSLIPSDIPPKDRLMLYAQNLNREKQELWDKKISKMEGLDIAKEGLTQFFKGTDPDLKRYMELEQKLKVISPLVLLNRPVEKETGGSFISNVANIAMKGMTDNPIYKTEQDDYRAISEALGVSGTRGEISPISEERLKEGETVTPGSQKFWENTIGGTASIVLPMMVTGGLYKGLTQGTKLAEALSSLKAGKPVMDVLSSPSRFGTALQWAQSKAPRWMKMLTAGVESGVTYEAAGEMFKPNEDELNFLSGLFGGIGKEAAGLLFGKLFSGAPEQAKKLLSYLGGGGGETSEEFMQTIVKAWQQTPKGQSVIDELKKQFPDADSVVWGVVASFMMGSTMSASEGSEFFEFSKEEFNKLDPAKKKQAEAIVSAMKNDIDNTAVALSDGIISESRNGENDKTTEGHILPTTETTTTDVTSDGEKSEVGTVEEKTSITEPLKDVESTSSALKELVVAKTPELAGKESKSEILEDLHRIIPFEQAREIMRVIADKTGKDTIPIADIVSEAYHKAKADGSNPELVSAVEKLLGQDTAPIQSEETKVETPQAEVTVADIDQFVADGKMDEDEASDAKDFIEGKVTAITKPAYETAQSLKADGVKPVEESKVDIQPNQKTMYHVSREPISEFRNTPIYVFDTQEGANEHANNIKKEEGINAFIYSVNIPENDVEKEDNFEALDSGALNPNAWGKNVVHNPESGFAFIKNPHERQFIQQPKSAEKQLTPSVKEKTPVVEKKATPVKKEVETKPKTEAKPVVPESKKKAETPRPTIEGKAEQGDIVTYEGKEYRVDSIDKKGKMNLIRVDETGMSKVTDVEQKEVGVVEKKETRQAKLKAEIEKNNEKIREITKNSFKAGMLIDPREVGKLVRLAGANAIKYIELGIHNFADFAKAMVDGYGDIKGVGKEIEPYLSDIWNEPLPKRLDAQERSPKQIAEDEIKINEGVEKEFPKREKVGEFAGQNIYSVGANTFHKALRDAATARTEDGVQVEVKKVEDLQALIDIGGKLFLSDDGTFGAYVNIDGYMGGLFKHPDSKVKGVSKFMQPLRMQYGGRFFDAYATYLEALYISNGYRPVARLLFNEKYAPKGWEKTTLKTKPDVVFFVYDPESERKEGEGKYFEDYEEAYKFAQELSEKYEGELPSTEKTDPRTEEKGNGSVHETKQHGEDVSEEKGVTKEQPSTKGEPGEKKKRKSIIQAKNNGVDSEILEALPDDVVHYLTTTIALNDETADYIIEKYGVEKAHQMFLEATGANTKGWSFRIPGVLDIQKAVSTKINPNVAERLAGRLLQKYGQQRLTAMNAGDEVAAKIATENAVEVISALAPFVTVHAQALAMMRGMFSSPEMAEARYTKMIEDQFRVWEKANSEITRAIKDSFDEAKTEAVESAVAQGSDSIEKTDSKKATKESPAKVLGYSKADVKAMKEAAKQKMISAMKNAPNILNKEAIAALAEYGYAIALDGAITLKTWLRNMKADLPDIDEADLKKVWEDNKNKYTDPVKENKKAIEKKKNEDKRLSELATKISKEETKARPEKKESTLTPEQQKQKAHINGKYGVNLNDEQFLKLAGKEVDGVSVADMVQERIDEETQQKELERQVKEQRKAEERAQKESERLSEKERKEQEREIERQRKAEEANRKREYNEALKPIATEHFNSINPKVQDLAKELENEFGLTEAESIAEAKRITEKYNSEFEKKQKAIVEKKINETTSNPATRKRMRTLSERLLALEKSGTLTKEEYRNAIADVFKLKKFDQKTADRLSKLAGEYENATDPIERMRIEQEQHNIMHNASMSTPQWYAELFWEYYYAKMLSGPKTHVLNFMANVLQGFAEMIVVPLAYLARGRFQEAANYYSGAFENLVHAVGASAFVFGTGYNVDKFNKAVKSSGILEQMKVAGKFESGKLKGIPYVNPIALFKFVARTMSATDSFFYYMHEGATQKAFAVERAKEILKAEGNTKPTLSQIQQKANDLQNRQSETIANTRAQIEREFPRKNMIPLLGKATYEAQVHARLIARLNEGIDKKVRERAGLKALIATYMNPPQGALGLVARNLNLLISTMPVLRMWVPFVNVVANVMNEGINWTPLGFARGTVGSISDIWGEGREKLGVESSSGKTRQDKAEQLVKASLGLTVLVLVLSLDQSDDDDGEDNGGFRINGRGPTKDIDKRNAWLQDPDNMEYSFRIPGVGLFSYKNTPMGAMLSVAGNFKDAIRHDGYKPEDHGLISKLITSVGSAASTMADQSFVSGMNGLISAIAEKSPEQQEAKINRVLAKTLTSLSPVTGINLVNQIHNAWDNKVYKPENFMEYLMNEIPGLRQQLNTRTSYTGEPVTRHGSTFNLLSFDRFYRNPGNEDSVMKLFSHHNVWPTKPSETTELNDARMSDEVYREYEILSNRMTTEKMMSDYNRLMNLSREEFDEEYKTIRGDARSEAHDILAEKYLPSGDGSNTEMRPQNEMIRR